MKNFLHSVALFIICVSAAVPVLAECPEGKSEVLLMTPSGITKTICISDNAIPGIENAAANPGGFTLEPACPCLDVWDGPLYPDGTLYDVGGSIIPLPPQIPEGSLCTENSNTSGRGLNVLLYDTGSQLFVAEYIAHTGENTDMCYMDKNGGSGVSLMTSGQQLFTDASVSPTTGLYTSSMMDACKALLEYRGCVFP